MTDTRASVAARTLGRTLELEDVAPGSLLGMDLVLHGGPDGRDLGIVSGADALGQDLKVAILTPLGEDLLNQTFGYEGLRAMTVQSGIRFVEEMLRLATMRVLATDPRISKVIDVTVERVDPLTRAWRVTATAQTVLDEIVSLTLGEVGQDA